MIDAAQTPLQGSCRSRAEERAILTVTCSAAFLFFNSFGSIGVALPAIQKQFGNSLSEIQWVTLMGVVTVSMGSGLGALSMSFVELLLARVVMA